MKAYTKFGQDGQELAAGRIAVLDVETLSTDPDRIKGSIDATGAEKPATSLDVISEDGAYPLSKRHMPNSSIHSINS